jgi:hypothetical protein
VPENGERIALKHGFEFSLEPRPPLPGVFPAAFDALKASFRR